MDSLRTGTEVLTIKIDLASAATRLGRCRDADNAGRNRISLLQRFRRSVPIMGRVHGVDVRTFVRSSGAHISQCQYLVSDAIVAQTFSSILLNATTMQDHQYYLFEGIRHCNPTASDTCISSPKFIVANY